MDNQGKEADTNMPVQEISQFIVANLPALLLLCIGFVLVVVEIFIPGFGAPGIIGAICLIAGVALKANNALEALIMVVVIISLLAVALSISLRSASKGRLSKSNLILNDVSTTVESLSSQDLDFYVNKKGVSKTPLRPAGIADFDGVRLNVVSDGDVIATGTEVLVDHVEGNKIVVKPLSI